jgi:hypothetical protein
VALVVTALGSTGENALAQSAADRATAQALFDQGKELRDQGQIEQACPKFAESLRLDPTVGTRFNLADCYERTRRLASAWTHFLEVAAATELAGQAQRAAAARARAEALAKRLPKLRITPSSRVAGLTIRVDGTELREAAWSTDVPADLGSHDIEATAPGHEPWRKSIVIDAEGAKIALEVPALVERPDGAGSGGEGVRGPESGDSSQAGGAGSSSAVATTGLVLGGVGLAALVAGGAFGLVAMSKKSDVDELCPDYDNCTVEGIETNDEATLYGHLSTVGFVAGGALLVTGLIMWLAAPAEAEPSSPEQPHELALRVRPVVGIEGIGLALDSAF